MAAADTTMPQGQGMSCHYSRLCVFSVFMLLFQGVKLERDCDYTVELKSRGEQFFFFLAVSVLRSRGKTTFLAQAARLVEAVLNLERTTKNKNVRQVPPRFRGEEESGDSVREDGVFIEIKKLQKNSRRIRSKISINASLDTVWKILTDYEKLADFIPGLAVSKLIDKKDKFARLYQIGQQNLAFGLKFNAKAILDCYERDLQTLASGEKRDIEFKMTEGDFQFFEGKWSIEQLAKPKTEDSAGQEYETTLSYLVDVKPKMWLPVNLIEGRICTEIKSNLTCIREEAQKVIDDAQHDQ
ncbi:hypothetical protein D5086_026136 [Populus alba]|uniref:Uncharacterized protein n=1 Tax=Populus alba TaxID=43335 RepID=A0ACC4B123_POPAL